MNAARLSFRKKIAPGLLRRYRKNEARLHPLNYILWECTLRCNLQCLHCGSDCRKESAVKDMPAGDFLRALDELKGLVNPHKTMIVLTGGEALMRNDVAQIGQQLYARGFPWGLVTNGMMLQKNRLEALLAAGLRAVTVSLDGLEAAHNWLRGAATGFQKALAAIRLLAQTPDLRFDVVTCANRNNIGDLPQLKTLLRQTGVKQWRIFTIFPLGRAKRHEALQLDTENFRALFEFIRQTRKEGEIKLSLGSHGGCNDAEKSDSQ